MMTLFDDEYILKTYVEDEKRKAAKKAAEKAATEAAKAIAYELFDRKFPVETIADILKISENTIQNWLDERMAVVK